MIGTDSLKFGIFELPGNRVPPSDKGLGVAAKEALAGAAGDPDSICPGELCAVGLDTSDTSSGEASALDGVTCG